jgi:hypothetical protein
MRRMALLLVASAWAGACGSPTDSDTDTDASSNSAVAGTGGSVDPCAEPCKFGDDCFHRGCVDLCYDMLGAPDECEAHMQAYVDCVSLNYVTCTVIPTSCVPLEYDARMCAFAACTAGGPGALSPNGSCSCTATAAGARYEIDCSSDVNGIIGCECTVDNMNVGSCTEDAATDACNAAGGCCWEELFT